MEIKELKIGNCLHYKNTNDIAIVELIHKKHFDCRDEYGSFTPNGNYQPIPLTEEWLLKFGFKKHGAYEFYFDILNYETSNFFDEHIEKTNLQFYIYNEHKIEVKIDIDATNVEGEFEGKTLFLKHIQYVHQLQNLYFALTNEELTWK
jgi:hypothetical protein